MSPSWTALCTAILFATVQGGEYPLYADPHCEGNRTGIVHLFEWTWTSIARECQLFLGPYGYCALQTSPVTEHRVIFKPFRTWWENYGPVSYKIASRQGTEEEFKAMVKTCNDNGVRVMVDIVLNHMAGIDGKGYGTAGSYFNSKAREFSGVPFNVSNFNDYNNVNCSGPSAETDPVLLRTCGLMDLNTSSEYVRAKQAEHLAKLIDYGVAGFRVDSALRMFPEDLESIFGRLKDVQQGGRPFIYQEFIHLNDNVLPAEDYYRTGRTTNFNVAKKFAYMFLRQLSMNQLATWDKKWLVWPSDHSVVFVDNHDIQRGHGNPGPWLTHWTPTPYKLATAFMLAHPYGYPRVMSSFEYDRVHDTAGDQGPPMNPDMSIREVTYDGLKCTGGWTCEHRWRVMYSMIRFRSVVHGTGVDNWWSGSDYQLAFSRGNKGFFVLNWETFPIETTLQTGLSAGTYCDVITGEVKDGICTGRTVTVRNDGTALIYVSNEWTDPMIAIHVGAKLPERQKPIVSGKRKHRKTKLIMFWLETSD